MKSKVHVQVNNYKNKRILILESAKTLTKQLKIYDNLQRLRLQKRKRIKQLEKIAQDINYSVSQLKIKDVPYVHIGGSHEEIQVIEPKMKEPEVKKQPKEEPDPLTQELQEIERKLASLRQ